MSRLLVIIGMIVSTAVIVVALAAPFVERFVESKLGPTPPCQVSNTCR